MDVLFYFIFPLWEAYWRRGFGGLWNDRRIIGNRFIQHVLNVGALFALFYFAGREWYTAAYCAGIIEGLFWTRSHGAVFDFGTDSPSDKRYSCWYCRFILDRIFRPAYKASYWYDAAALFIRYTAPCFLIVPALGWGALAAGLIVTPIYALFFHLVREVKVIGGAYSAYSEIACGFLCGVIFALIA